MSESAPGMGGGEEGGDRPIPTPSIPRIATLLSFPLTHPSGVATFAAALLEALERDFVADLRLIAPNRFRGGPKQRASQILLAAQQFIELVRLRPDVVHNHEHTVLLMAAVAYRAVAGPRVRVVHTVHIDPAQRLALWKRIGLGWLMGHCWAVTAVSEDTAGRLDNVAAPVPTAVRVIYCGAKLPVRDRDDPAVASFRSAIGLTGSPVLCQVGTLNFPLKVAGVLKLVEAFVLVRETFPEARLLIVGDGRLRVDVEAACVRAGVGGAAVVTGHVDDVSLPLALADVYCQITLQDACPLSLLEAMASGKASVASRTGGIPELISEGVEGVLVDAAPAAIAQAITGLLEHPEELRACGARAAATARIRFTWERVAAQFAALYGLAPRAETVAGREPDVWRAP